MQAIDRPLTSCASDLSRSNKQGFASNQTCLLTWGTEYWSMALDGRSCNDEVRHLGAFSRPSWECGGDGGLSNVKVVQLGTNGCPAEVWATD